MSDQSQPGAGAPNEVTSEEDPLVELARIVSGGNTFEDAMNSGVAEPGAMGVGFNDPASDLENELMRELEIGMAPQAPLTDQSYQDDAFTTDQQAYEALDNVASAEQGAPQAPYYQDGSYAPQDYYPETGNPAYTDDPAGVFAEPSYAEPQYAEQPYSEPQYSDANQTYAVPDLEQDLNPAPSEPVYQEPPVFAEPEVFAEPDPMVQEELPVAPQQAENPPPQMDVQSEIDFDSAFQAELENSLGAAPQTAVSELPAEPPLQTQMAPPTPVNMQVPADPQPYGAGALAPETEIAMDALEAELHGEPAAPVDDLGAFPPAVEPQATQTGTSGAATAAMAGAAALGGAAIAATQRPAQATTQSVFEDDLTVHPQAARAETLDTVVPPVGAAISAEADDGGRSKFMLAAAFGGLIVLGGIAVFAFNSGSGDVATSQQVALIEADKDPVKIKPEDPGGVSIPNQDKAVYERIGNGEGQTEAAPQQETLVVGSEEPAVALNDASKSEDRLGQTDTQQAVGGNSLLAPRKVKTVVVKPDGTIVPVDETPAPQPAQNEQVAMIKPLEEAVVQAAEPQAPSASSFEGGTAATGSIPLPQTAPAGLQVNDPARVQVAAPVA